MTGTYLWWELQCDEVTTPVTAGSFDYIAQYNGRPYWKNEGPVWYMWYDTASNKYRITNALGANDGGGDNWWLPADANTPIGLFQPQGTAATDLYMDMPTDPDCQLSVVTS